MTLPSPLSEDFKDGLIRTVARAGGLLLCTDFDGTLVNFTEIPDETSLTEETEELLKELSQQERLDLAVISGRSLSELEDLVRIEGITLAGNHGLKIRFEDGTEHEIETGERIHRTISSLKTVLREGLAEEEGILIEDKYFGLALHYRQYDGDEERVKKEFEKIWRDHSIPELELIKGAQLLEVRPEDWNKGDAVKLLQERREILPTIYIGDDTTDEDAFEVLRDQGSGISILVSQREESATKAEYRLNSPKEVRAFLKEILDIFSGS